MQNSIRGILSIMLLGALLALFPNTSAAQQTDELSMPVWGEDLDKVMEWIGKETSRENIDFCWKDTYARQTYTSQKQCEDKEGNECVQLGLLWYVRCLPGYETSVVPNCLAKCPTFDDVQAGAQNVKYDCGLLCALGPNECASGIIDMVYAPIFMALNIISFGTTAAAKKAATQVALAGTNAAVGGAASQATSGITRSALSNSANGKWTKLLNALDKAEEVFDVVTDTKDKVDYTLQVAEDLETELNRWTGFWSNDQNFSELTSYRINDEINRRFPNDHQSIKAAYGQYQLVTMLEADGWRIAKTALSHASNFDPIGILETINAFAHPVCNPVPTPFPDVKILTIDERIKKTTPYVSFYPKDGITLDEAKNIAKQKKWTIATREIIYNACVYHDLNVPNLGWASDGNFVLPTRPDIDSRERESSRLRKIWDNIYKQGPGGDSKNTASDVKGFYYWSDGLTVIPVDDSDIELMKATVRSLARRAGESGAKIGFTSPITQRFAKEAAVFAELAIDFENGYFGNASAHDVITTAVANNQVDAAFFHHGRKVSYFFQGNQYYRFKGTKAEEGYPKALPGGWQGLPTSFLSGLDATLYKRDNEKIYFFQGDEFVRITDVKVDPGYPQKISEGFSGLPADFHHDIDAALYSSGKTYLFKNNEYVRITGTKMDAGYPQSIKGKWGFSSAFTQGIDAALPYQPNSKNYIFEGGKYARLSGTGMDIGYPLFLPGGWEGLKENRAVSKHVNEVKFYSKNSVTLEEAKKIARENDWKLASSTDLTAAFKYKNLNVYAFGMMADGRFAVPIQSDAPNFKKGLNIGAAGGNQGFFYTIYQR